MVSDLYASLAEPPFQLSKAATANMPKVSASIVSDLDAPAVPTPAFFVKPLQDAFAVQQFAFFAVASLPAVASAFVGSLNCVELQGFEERPPHFVVSGSQQIALHDAAFVADEVQYKSVNVLFFL